MRLAGPTTVAKGKRQVIQTAAISHFSEFVVTAFHFGCGRFETPSLLTRLDVCLHNFPLAL
jgi:hypothetical protein